ITVGVFVASSLKNVRRYKGAMSSVAWSATMLTTTVVKSHGCSSTWPTYTLSTAQPMPGGCFCSRDIKTLYHEFGHSPTLNTYLHSRAGPCSSPSNGFALTDRGGNRCRTFSLG